MTSQISVGNVKVGGGAPFALIAGPCVAENRDLCLKVAEYSKSICDRLGIGYIFKASFDKANRASVNSPRGHGLDEGLEMLQAVKDEFGLPLLTDIHESNQVEAAAQVVDILQVPAFLCRQTDLVLAAANTGRVVNVKKGQFLAPWDMKNVVDKVVSSGNKNLMLTERGCSFGYNTLVVDMTSLPVMRSFGYPVIFDATHSVQRPGGAGTSSGGAREFVPDLVRAAVAVGVDALFLEIHPDPDNAWSDKASMLHMTDLEKVLTQAKAIENAINKF